jgi:hypothetical protein
MDTNSRLKRASPLVEEHLLSSHNGATKGHRRSPSDSGINALKVSIKDSFKKSVLGRSKSSAGYYHKHLAPPRATGAAESGSSSSNTRNTYYPFTPSDPHPSRSSTSNGSIPKIMVDAEHPSDFKIPLLLQRGTPLMKISSKKAKTVMFTLDADAGLIRWESKKDGKSMFHHLILASSTDRTKLLTTNHYSPPRKHQRTAPRGRSFLLSSPVQTKRRIRTPVANNHLYPPSPAIHSILLGTSLQTTPHRRLH